MGSKNNPGQFDCYANALPDEPMFTLLGRDPSAPDLVGEWANRREAEIAAGTRPIEDQWMVIEARQCSANMRAWRRENDGAWRKAAPNTGVPARPLKSRDIDALSDADKHPGGWALFKLATTERLAARGFFEKAEHPSYGNQFRITAAGRDALKAALAAQD